jgi:1-phosphofructokinase family hexose kinase
MIRVVGANPAMDRISIWPGFRLGEVNRAASVTVVPGGKGFNVARATIRLGSRAASYGFLGGPVGEALRAMIRADGVIDRHTDVAAGTRVCFIVVEPDAGRATVLNEPGPAVTTEESARFTAALAAGCQAGDNLVLSGSLPDSLDPSVAAEVVAIGQAAGARTFVDIHGASLRAAASQRPWMLKCNRDELLGLLQEDRPTGAQLERHQQRPLADIAREMVELRGRGIPVVVVTLGAQGALLADDEGVCHASVPEVDSLNPTGSGDLLLAGLVVGLERGWSLRQALVLGAACGTAGATHLLPELPPGFEAEAWMARIRLSELGAAP